jgi:hypothetical protein
MEGWGFSFLGFHNFDLKPILSFFLHIEMCCKAICQQSTFST